MMISLILGKGGLFDPIAKPLAAVLAFFYSVVPNYGIAIVLLTVAMMLVLTPLTIKQTRSMLVMQKLQPEMKKLQEQHKNDRQALNEAMMALYKEHNTSPLGGCLPMLLPMPVFFALFRLLEGLSHVVHNGKAVVAAPKYLSPHTQMYQDIVKAHGQLDAFGMNLAKSAQSVGGGFVHSLPYFVLLMLMIGTQFYQQYQLTSKNPAAKSQPGQAMMMKIFPLFFGVISFQFPAGVVLYWTVSNMIRVAQQWGLYRYDPKVRSLVAKDIQEIEAKTREIDAKEKRPPGRAGFRALLGNAADAAADRKAIGGKNAAKPGGKSVGDKAAGAGRGARSQAGNPSGSTRNPNKSLRPGTAPGGKPSGTQKGTPQKPGQRAGTPRAGGSVKPSGLPKAGGTVNPGGQANPGGGPTPKSSGPTPKVKGPTPKASAPTPKAGGTVKPGGQPNASGTLKPAAASSAAAAPGAPAASGPAAKSPPNSTISVPGSQPANGTKVTAATGAGGNGAGTPSGNGAAAGEGSDGAERAGTGAPKGRTGGGSARHVGNRRRRRGR